MTSLVASLSTGKGTWTQVLKLIASHDWDQIFLITNSFGKEKFQPPKEVEFVVIDDRKPLRELVEDISARIRGKIAGFEVAVNIVSGTGKEHMALLSAVIKQGLALRLVDVDEKGIVEV